MFVQDSAGTEVSGKLVGIRPDALVLRIDGVEHRIDRDHVRRIQKRDSLKNGAVVGTLVGAVVGGLGAGIADCPGREAGGPCPGARVGLAALAVITYAGFGLGLDAMVKGRTTIYAAPPGPAAGRDGRASSRSRCGSRGAPLLVGLATRA